MTAHTIELKREEPLYQGWWHWHCCLGTDIHRSTFYQFHPTSDFGCKKVLRIDH